MPTACADKKLYYLPHNQNFCLRDRNFLPPAYTDRQCFCFACLRVFVRAVTFLKEITHRNFISTVPSNGREVLSFNTENFLKKNPAALLGSAPPTKLVPLQREILDPSCLIGRSRGALPTCAPLCVQILSFLHTNFPQCYCVGPWPALRDPPPAKSSFRIEVIRSRSRGNYILY